MIRNRTKSKLVTSPSVRRPDRRIRSHRTAKTMMARSALSIAASRIDQDAHGRRRLAGERDRDDREPQRPGHPLDHPRAALEPHVLRDRIAPVLLLAPRGAPSVVGDR